MPGNIVRAVLLIGVLLYFTLANNSDPASTNGAWLAEVYIKEEDEAAFQRRRYDVLSQILTKETVIAFDSRDGFPVLTKQLKDDMVNMMDHEDSLVSWKKRKTGWTNDYDRFIVKNDELCVAVQDFQELGNDMKPHVLISLLDQNWGAVSTYVRERTVNWGTFQKNMKEAGCTMEEIFRYLHHPNMVALITSQHHAFNHPKVHSVPIGIDEDPKLIMKSFAKSNRTSSRSKLLMINFATDNKLAQDRKRIADFVIETFQKSGLSVQNTYGYDSLKSYYDEMLSSKFVLGPSGLGWDCHRFWEAFYMGAIPVIETYYRDDGWRRVMDDLPVLWVDHFRSVTPELLEQEYPKIMAKWKSYKWEKLTISYWVEFVKSFEDSRPQSSWL